MTPRLFRAALLWAGLTVLGAHAEQVLVTVAGTDITDIDLERTLNSSPFATQFPSWDEKTQARLRGDILTRLVQAELLTQEALAQGLDKTDVFQKEVNNFRTGLLYQRYLSRLRDAIHIPADHDKALREKFKDNPDALAAARSLWVSEHYDELRKSRMAELKKKYRVKVYTDRLGPKTPRETVVAEGDGFKVTLGDLVKPDVQAREPAIEARLNEVVEILMGARAAEEAGVDVTAEVQRFARELLPRLLLDKKEKEWIPNQQVLIDYFQKHPKLGYIPEVRHIGQIVLKTREEAEKVRERILEGESLFELAGKLSIDPWGREHNGDMGWLREGSGMPQIEKVLKTLDDDEISPVIETPKGFHIVTIIGRRGAQQRSFNQIPDRVRRAYLNEKLPGYLKSLLEKYPVEWKMPDHPTSKAEGKKDATAS